MGADIHPAFETRRSDGTWELTFPVHPSDSWWDMIVDEKIENGSAALMFSDDGQTKPYPLFGGAVVTDETTAADAAYRRLVAYFEAIPPEEVIEKYGNDPLFQWGWEDSLPKSSGDSYEAAISTRNYKFFAAIAGVRSRTKADEFFEPRGIPDDLSPRLRHRFTHQLEHTPSWLMVSELLDNPAFAKFVEERRLDEHAQDLSEFEQRKKYWSDYTVAPLETYRSSLDRPLEWLRQHIADRANTRMVFFFDS